MAARAAFTSASCGIRRWFRAGAAFLGVSRRWMPERLGLHGLARQRAGAGHRLRPLELSAPPPASAARLPRLRHCRGKCSPSAVFRLGFLRANNVWASAVATMTSQPKAMLRMRTINDQVAGERDLDTQAGGKDRERATALGVRRAWVWKVSKTRRPKKRKEMIGELKGLLRLCAFA